VRRHELRHLPILANGRAVPAAEIAIGQDSDDLGSVHHDEVVDARGSHLMPRGFGIRIGPDREHLFRHDFFDPHERRAFKNRAGHA